MEGPPTAPIIARAPRASSMAIRGAAFEEIRWMLSPTSHTDFTTDRLDVLLPDPGGVNINTTLGPQRGDSASC
jgi:hypothetical protein